MERIYLHQSIYNKAREIGEEMAEDPLIRPHLRNVAQYAGYFRFRLAHRAHLEQSQRFERHYQEHIYALADKEAKLRQMPRTDAMESWDRWYQGFVHPIKTIVWQTWERKLNLEARYLDALLTSGSAGPEDIRRMTGTREKDPEQMPATMAERSGVAQMPQRLVTSVLSSIGLRRNRESPSEAR